MRCTGWTACLALALPVAAGAAEVPVARYTTPAPTHKEVRVDFPVGSFRVEAGDARHVKLELTAECKRRDRDDCEEYADRIRLETDDDGDRIRIRVRGYPKIQFRPFTLHGVLQVPRDVALRIEMGVGALTIRDVEGDLDVDLGVGDADIRTPARAVRSVEVATGVGDAEVLAEGGRVRRRAFISCTADWDEGRGRSKVNLNVGVGDATVRVD